MQVRTTVVGPWPIPFGLRLRLREYYAGWLLDEAAAPVLTAAARIAIDQQRARGLGQVVGGETFAPDFLHHIPPRLDGLATLRARDTSKGHDGVGICEVAGRITAPRGAGHATAFHRESAIGPEQDKAPAPSPFTIGGLPRGGGEHYLADLVTIVQREARQMIEEGFKEIQLDVPAVAIGRVAGTHTIEEILPPHHRTSKGRGKGHTDPPFCLGDISRKTATTRQNLHSLMPLIHVLEGQVGRVHLECSYRGQWEERGVLRQIPDSIEVIAGIADVKAALPGDASLCEKIGDPLHIVSVERLLVSSSCGCGRVPHDQASRLMRDLVKAATSVG